MYHLPQELIIGFPALASKLSELKRRDEVFSQLADDYCEICQKTAAHAPDIGESEHEKLAQLREKRAQIKAQIAEALAAA